MRKIEKNRRRLSLLAAAALLATLVLGSASRAWAQPPAGARPPYGGPSPRSGTSPATPPEPPAPAVEFRDPTQPSPAMREAIEASQITPPAGSATAPAPVLPQIKLKARLFGTMAPPVALLEVNGQLVQVSSGGEFVVSSPASGVSTIVVRELTVNSVQVEVLPLKKILILR